MTDGAGPPMAGAPYWVGTGRAGITPPIGAPLGGYGARHGVSDRVAAPLLCSAFAFHDGTTTVCIVTCDLLYVTTDIVDAVRAEASARSGISPQEILLTATHTHSGPANLTQVDDGQYVAFLATRVGDAIDATIRSMQPATIRLSIAELGGISMNRRDPAGPVETKVRCIIAESTADRRTIAVLMSYACHPTVLESDSLAISPDFPGAAVSFVERATGAMAGYLQGCSGALNPVWIDHTVAEVTRIGSVLGSVVVRQVLEGQGVALPRRSVNLSINSDVAAPPSPLSGVVISGAIWCDSGAARVRRRETRDVSAIDAEVADVNKRPQPEGERAGHRGARLAALHAERYLSMGGFRYWRADRSGSDDDDMTDTLHISGMGFGSSLALVGIPGEPFLEIGEKLRRRAAVDNLVVCGYANGTVGYLPTRRAFQDYGYEVGMARYEPDAAGRIVDAGVAALRRAVG